MKINDMTVYDCMDRMGSEASWEEGSKMLFLLVESDYQTTEEVPDDVWSDMISTVVAAVNVS